MTHLRFMVSLCLIAVMIAKDPDCYRNTYEMALARGFYAENHTVTTADGYVLLTFRISLNKTVHGEPVLIAHGVLGCSDNMLDNGDDSLGYMLANLGYDVWLMNNRGNKYSKSHISLNPNTDAKYWEFSLHEIGLFDIRENVNYITKITGYRNLHYVGYSQSGGAILAALTEDYQFYKDHLKSITLWAPVSNMEHSSGLLRLLYWSYTLYVLEFFGFRELFPYDPTLSSLSSVLCKLNPAFCNLLLAIVTDLNPYYDNQGRWEVITSHFPAGTSVLSLLHMLELNSYSTFMKHRKSVLHSVEEYDMDRIGEQVPIAVMVGKNDQLVVSKDTQWLAGVLSKRGCLSFYKEYSFMGHLTFMLPSKIVQEFLLDTVRFIQEHQILGFCYYAKIVCL
eukprot:TRINITY_DN2937_c0_g1_i1.p1 TRINITY_DN2937_c0_g1~~TRINITY_DN2937_c0_g1_i1.p1  ORF type:complete len:433 (-),score=9.63 TRINITY_DN2937_c0_g1_i1:19-1197(-)